jgi:hypothetical protein
MVRLFSEDRVTYVAPGTEYDYGYYDKRLGIFFFYPIGESSRLRSNKNKRKSENKMANQIEETNNPTNPTSPLFRQLRSSITEHSAGQFLRLKDGESVVVNVLVNYDATNPANNTPREEEVLNFDKSKKIWKLRLDCYVGNNTENTKIFHVRSQDKSEVISLLERGVRKMRISRYGTSATTTKYVFSPVE